MHVANSSTTGRRGEKSTRDLSAPARRGSRGTTVGGGRKRFGAISFRRVGVKVTVTADPHRSGGGVAVLSLMGLLVVLHQLGLVVVIVLVCLFHF